MHNAEAKPFTHPHPEALAKFFADPKPFYSAEEVAEIDGAADVAEYLDEVLPQYVDTGLLQPSVAVDEDGDEISAVFTRDEVERLLAGGVNAPPARILVELLLEESEKVLIPPVLVRNFLAQLSYHTQMLTECAHEWDANGFCRRCLSRPCTHPVMLSGSWGGREEREFCADCLFAPKLEPISPNFVQRRSAVTTLPVPPRREVAK